MGSVNRRQNVDVSVTLVEVMTFLQCQNKNMQDIKYSPLLHPEYGCMVYDFYCYRCQYASVHNK